MINAHDKFSYKGRRWMPGIFDTNAVRRVLKTSRQVGKSTLGAAEGASRPCLYNDFNILYVCPIQDQARKFSQDKLNPMIENSAILKSQIAVYNNVHEKEFKKGGKYYLKYARDNADRCRGISCDMIHYDEIQDQDLSLIEPVISECLFTSNYKLRLYSGTPKSLENGIEKKWQESDQREWLVRCYGCNKYNKLGISNIGLNGPICSGCGKYLDVDSGIWVITNPGSNIAGFHVNQLHCKASHTTAADWQEIIDKYEGDDYSDDMFLNEVLGESADSSETPITESLLMRLANPLISNKPKATPDQLRGFTVAGIDWGHGQASTVIVIGSFTKDGVFQNIFIREFTGQRCDPDICLPEITKICKDFRVSRIHVDHGGSFGILSQFKRHLGKNKAKLLTTNAWSDSAKAKDQTWATKDLAVPRLTLNRSNAIGQYISKMRAEKVHFPNWKSFQQFKEHFLSIRQEIRPRDDSVRYVRVGLDDAFHASIYAYIIGKLHMKSQL